VSLILDTNVLFASLDRRDQHHDVCRELILNADEARVVPAPVLVELDYFIRTRLTEIVHVAFLRDITEGAYYVEDLRHEDYLRVREICAKYSDHDIGLVDASIVAIAERLNETKVATIDHRHFGLIRPRHVKSFQLVPTLTPSRPRRKLKS
jgi:predicted nucleic acid-binding protein